MGRVVADMSVTLDGFVAGPHDEMEHVFSWYGKPQPTPPDATTEAGAGGLGLGVIVYGRRTFDVARGWGGTHPTGAPVLVVTHRLPEGWPHEGSSVGFATDGVELAMERAQEIAGPRDVALGLSLIHIFRARSGRRAGPSCSVSMSAPAWGSGLSSP